MEMGHPTPVRQPRLLQGHLAPSVGSQMLRSNWYTLFLGSHMLQLFYHFYWRISHWTIDTERYT